MEVKHQVYAEVEGSVGRRVALLVLSANFLKSVEVVAFGREESTIECTRKTQCHIVFKEPGVFVDVLS